MRRGIIYIGVLLFTFTGCSEQTNESSLLVNEGQQNPFVAEERVGSNEIHFEGGTITLKQESDFIIQEISQRRSDIFFKAKKIPTELYLKNKGVHKAELAEALLATSGEQLFYFEFQEVQKLDLVSKYFQADLDGNISYLSFEIAQDFQLITKEGDTLQADYTVYERNFHVAPFERLLVSFSGIASEEGVSLVYHDKLFGKGKMQFQFAPEELVTNYSKNPS